MLGSGAVWEEVIASDISTRLALNDVPAHWAKLWGVDFGIAHPFAAVLTAWDKDADVIYVLDCFKMSGGVPSGHASRMNAIARGVPVAFPHDGSARDKGSGDELAAIYKREGLAMLGTHATHSSGGYATEPGITEMLTRMRDARFKVASHLSDWFDEARQYHRKEGQIIKLNDDLMSATRIAVMARRYAKAGGIGRSARFQHSDHGWAGAAKPRVVSDWNPWTGRAWQPGDWRG
jgi:hypothetical protein